MAQQTHPQRCRIVLAYDVSRDIGPETFAALLKAGDVASVILHNTAAGKESAAFQKKAARLVPVIQEAGCAAIIAGDSRIAGRLKADGLHIENSLQDLEAATDKHRPAMIIGYGGLRDRHSAMEAGERQPDYLLFGKLGLDKKPEPHPRNLTLGYWWASMIEIPCIIQAGSTLQGIIAIARSGAEFVALEEAVFAAPDKPLALKNANSLLDRHQSETGDHNE